MDTVSFILNEKTDNVDDNNNIIPYTERSTARKTLLVVIPESIFIVLVMSTIFLQTSNTT